MKFEWDESKNRHNIEKHDISFDQASSMFDQPLLTDLDIRKDYGEDRWIGVGLLKSGKVAVVVFTERQNDVIRIFSARKATQYESKLYHEYVGY